MRATQWQLGIVCLAVLWIGLNAGADDVVPFPEALDTAAVTVDRLDNVLDYALLIGNGDVNALVYTERGQLKLNLPRTTCGMRGWMQSAILRYQRSSWSRNGRSIAGRRGSKTAPLFSTRACSGGGARV